MSATKRTLDLLREHSIQAAVVERWVPWKGNDASGEPRRGGNRKDLWGFADLLACAPGFGIFAVQTFTTDWNGHVEKIASSEVWPFAEQWLLSGGGLYLVGWRKLVKERGLKLKVWKPRVGKYVRNTITGAWSVAEFEVDDAFCRF